MATRTVSATEYGPLGRTSVRNTLAAALPSHSRCSWPDAAALRRDIDHVVVGPADIRPQTKTAASSSATDGTWRRTKIVARAPRTAVHYVQRDKPSKTLPPCARA
jgi:hypothetical protein